MDEESGSIGKTLELLIILPFLLIATLSTVFGNALVMLAWAFQPSIRKPSNAYLVSLAFVDFLVGVTVLINDIAIVVNSGWIKHPTICKLHEVAAIGLCTVSIFHLIAIAADRYRTVVEGVTYIQRRSIKSVILKVGCLWVIGFWIALPPALDWDDRNWPDISTGVCKYKSSAGWILHSAFGSFYFPTFLIVTIYGRIYFRIKEMLQAKANKFQTKDSIHPEASSRVSITSEDDDEGKTKNPVVTFQGQRLPKEVKVPKDKVKFSLEKERGAAKTLGVIIGAFLACWLPFFIVHTTKAFLPQDSKISMAIPAELYQALAFLGHANSGVNPIIYCVYNLTFRKAFKSIFSAGFKFIRQPIASCKKA